MIDLYTAATPNGHKVSIALEELDLPYQMHHLSLSDNEQKEPLFIVNPKIISKSDELISYEEGCLSIPNQFAEVKRPSTCKLNFLDYNGEKKEINADGLLATCIQHEVDHLNGVLFIDHLSKLKKDLILKKTKKQIKEIDRVIV